MVKNKEMLAIFVLGLIILLIISTFLFKKKPVTDKSKKASNTKKILALTALVVFTVLIINTFLSDGVRYFYCLSDNNCITVWKRDNGEVLIKNLKKNLGIESQHILTYIHQKHQVI